MNTLKFKDRDLLLRPAVTSLQAPELRDLELDVDFDVGNDLVRNFNHDLLRQVEPKW